LALAEVVVLPQPSVLGGAVPTSDLALAEIVDLLQPSVVGGAVPTSRAWQNSKRLFDFVLAVIALVVLSPLLLLIALAVRLDTPGPVLFRQQRYGRDRKRFVVFKFRSMYDGVSAEAHRRYITKLATNEDRVGPGLKKLTDDPRVTRIGAFLRRTSLDELPQFINVVRGDMSIIGPRPALDYELEHYEPAHYVRFSVRPGLTGLWQVSGRSELGFLEMLTLDAEYARTTAPGVDAMILLRTPRALLRGKAA
jgi:lipopolysaccharide/colanic/teichoic acid biosynthesis glycosyltransferase